MASGSKPTYIVVQLTAIFLYIYNGCCTYCNCGSQKVAGETRGEGGDQGRMGESGEQGRHGREGRPGETWEMGDQGRQGDQ